MTAPILCHTNNYPYHTRGRQAHPNGVGSGPWDG